MRNHILKRVVMVAATFVVALVLSAPAGAGSLRSGSRGSSGSAVTGSLPGEVLWTYYETTFFGQPCISTAPQIGGGCNHEGTGDNILRLINPNGAANGNLAGAKTQTVCAMIYVFDDDEEMGECCGCPLSSAQLATFSVNHNLTSNWGITGPAGGFEGIGAIAIVAASVNTALLGDVPLIPLDNGHGCALSQSAACNGGCDPTNTPGYSVTTANNLLGSITHNQLVQAGPTDAAGAVLGINEIALSDDAGGDPTNLIYLQNQCGALVGNGTQGGICNCPIE